MDLDLFWARLAVNIGRSIYCTRHLVQVVRPATGGGLEISDQI